MYNYSNWKSYHQSEASKQHIRGAWKYITDTNIMGYPVPVYYQIPYFQVFDPMQLKLARGHYVPANILVTPTVVTNRDCSSKNPGGIYPHLLSWEHFMHLNPNPLHQQDRAKNTDVTHVDGYRSSDKEDYGTRQEVGSVGGTDDTLPNTKREEGIFMRERDIQESNQEHPHGQNINEEIARMPFRSGIREQRKDWTNISVDDEAGTSEKCDAKNKEVTINIDKGSRIIPEEIVEDTRYNRNGNVDLDEGDSSHPTSSNIEYDFAIYVGGIPARCGFSDLKTEIFRRNVKPNYIWKEDGFAVLNFHQSKITAEDVLESLKGLSLKQKELKLNIEPIHKYEDNNNRLEKQANRTQSEEAAVSIVSHSRENMEVQKDRNKNTEPSVDRSAFTTKSQKKKRKKTKKNRSNKNNSLTTSKDVKNQDDCEQNEEKDQFPEIKSARVNSTAGKKPDNEDTDSWRTLKDDVISAATEDEDGWGTLNNIEPVEW